MRGRWGNKVVGTAVALGLVLLSQTAFKMGVVGAAGETLSNPRIEKDDRMEAKQKVTYDCVWFGSYPQAEVIPSKSYTALDSCLRQKGDVIVSNSVYFALKKASNWDINNEIVLNGEKYRRIRSQDATYWNRGENVAAKYYRERYYHWENSTTYHYFKFEPIKWRILHINEKNQALVLSDIVLDGQKYHAEKENVTWEKSTLRSWLNGYGGGSNQKSVDYKQKNFFYSAFNSTEQMAILNTELENVDNYINGSSIDGGNNTVDKIFLLSEADIYEMEESESYGFAKDLRSGTSKTDEALLCKSSTYAKAMGICNTNPHFDDFTGTCSWWLRSQGQHKDYAAESECGWVDDIGIDVDYDENGIRPVLNLDLSHFQCYSYAGKVCTNESVENGNLPLSESKKGIGHPADDRRDNQHLRENHTRNCEQQVQTAQGPSPHQNHIDDQADHHRRNAHERPVDADHHPFPDKPGAFQQQSQKNAQYGRNERRAKRQLKSDKNRVKDAYIREKRVQNLF